jgi:hypothetical protein
MKTSILFFLEQVNQQRTGFLDVLALLFESAYCDLSQRRTHLLITSIETGMRRASVIRLDVARTLIRGENRSRRLRRARRFIAVKSAEKGSNPFVIT